MKAIIELSTISFSENGMKSIFCNHITLIIFDIMLATDGDKMKYLKKTLMPFYLLAILSVSFTASAEEMMTKPSLFERIGGAEVALKIVADAWENHSINPIIKNRFANSDPAYVKARVYEIFAASTGADVKYTGRDMASTHKSMNISEMEFNAVVDDVLAALEKNGVAQQERNEVLAILWSVRGDIVNSHIMTKNLKH